MTEHRGKDHAGVERDCIQEWHFCGARDGASDSETYRAFLATKRPRAEASGRIVSPRDVNRVLFPFQRDLVRWSVAKGRCAIFADAGLGKTFMQLEWARLTGERTLILAPLSVARQTVKEAGKLGLDVTYARSQSEASDGITITNYEMMHHFDAQAFGAVVLDESSILKATEGVYRNRLIETFSDTPYRLCCTATPAPNDIQEITNHSTFLGIMPRRDVLATFFLHAADDARASGWRLKNHARPAFWRWLAAWGMSLKRPSDLGYADEGYLLPELRIEPVIVDADVRLAGRLFADKLRGVTDRAEVRKQTKDARVAAAVDLIHSHPNEPWIVWCGLNDEGRDVAKALGDRAILVEGADSPEQKAASLEAFIDSTEKVLVTKPTIAGFGMNFQHCARMAFVGLSDSYEQYYQAIRRCWRFGQTKPVTAYIVLSEIERPIFDNVLRKEREAEEMARELVQHVADFEKAELTGTTAATFDYRPDETEGDGWKMMLGDSAERMAEIESSSVGLAVYSPPFQALYVYSPTERDLGNCASSEQFFEHMDFISRELVRVMKPGRIVAVHCAQITAQKVLDGVIGLKDFRGQLIDHYMSHGFTYHGEIVIDKDPQAQAIRTHAKGLLFVQKRKDSSWLRPALADYILVFRAPGENDEAVKTDISDEQWIEWARPIWYGIRETDTLQAPPKANDERHVAPLQLGTIERIVRLWSNVGDLVLSPFAGIGSEGYVALKHGRRFVGIELKPEYYREACKNLGEAKMQGTLL